MRCQRSAVDSLHGMVDCRSVCFCIKRLFLLVSCDMSCYGEHVQQQITNTFFCARSHAHAWLLSHVIGARRAVFGEELV